jgi:hypothetical protein
MWFVSVFDAKEHVTRKDIYRERASWLKNKEKVFQKKCKTIKRYEVIGSSPLKVFFLIETDDPKTLNVLSSHFGDAWDSQTFPVIERGIADLLKEEAAFSEGTAIVFRHSSRRIYSKPDQEKS